MGLLQDVLEKFGLIGEGSDSRAFTSDTEGAQLRWARDLRPLPGATLTAGHLVELYAVLDERHEPSDATPLRFDILDEDSFTPDDAVISLLGTGAAPSSPDVPTRQLVTALQELPRGSSIGDFVENFKRVVLVADGDLRDQLLVVKEPPARGGERGTRRTHVIAWHRIELGEGELYGVLDVGGALQVTSPVIEVGVASSGAAVAILGALIDAEPLEGVEPLECIPVTLGGRRAVSGEDGVFAIDARLPLGDHPLRFSRPGIDARELTVRVAADPASGVLTASIRDGQAELVRGTAPPSAAPVIALGLEPIALRVHKLRGTVLWPDSRGDDVLPAPPGTPPALGAPDPRADYRGSPLAQRRVYVLPLPSTGELASQRPKTTREWEQLKHRDEVLRSTRPGRPTQRERTGADGRFEVKYVDLSAGSRYLLWVERFAPRTTADATTEVPDHVVRTLRRELIRLYQANLELTGNAGVLLAQYCNLVDHEYNLTRDAVPWGVDALRVVDFPEPLGRTLVRPRRTNRDQFDAADALSPETGENHRIADDRIIDGAAQLFVHVLPLVPLDEPADARGEAARRARSALALAARAAFPAGYDAGQVKLALDVERLGDWIDWTAGPAWMNATTQDARAVELLERTLVVRAELGVGRTLPVDAARWHSDAVSLADSAFVAVPAPPEGPEDPVVEDRRLNASIGTAARIAPTHVPVLGALAPLLPGLAPRCVYLAPGHGLYPRGGELTSAARAHWDSQRGGYQLNAGEDEVDAFLAAEMRRIIVRNGGRVFAPREIADFTAAGVSNPAAASFLPVADADFPRLWQQNPVYYLGARDAQAEGHGVVTGNVARRSPIGAGRIKNSQGIDARVAHIAALARTVMRPHLVLAPHTNAGGGRGCIVEYLNVARAANDPAEGNPMGRGLSQRAVARILERTHIGEYGGGVRSMDRLNTLAVADLTGTFDHFRLENAGIDDVCQLRVRGPTTGDPPAAQPPATGHAASVVQCYNRVRNINPPQAVPVTGGGAWRAMPFLKADDEPYEIPVALLELAFHDSEADARLLSRAWFRRLAAEGVAIAIEAQLRADEAAVDDRAVQAVLRRVVGNTPAVTGLAPTGATATPETIRAAVAAAADPSAATAPPPATATLDALTSAALSAGHGLSRAGLVDLMRDELRIAAGWEATDAAATIETWVTQAITGGAPLERATETPTRAEAGELVCTAIGLKNAGLATAETFGVGESRQPLLRRAPDPASAAALFPRVEADLLIERLRTLRTRPQDVYAVADAWLADAAWSRLDTPRASGAYELDPGTPLLVVVSTAGVPWKTPHQSVEGGREDVEIRVRAGSERRTLRCSSRTPGHAVSATWFLDLPSTKEPIELLIELWVRHRSAGRMRVGTHSARLRVLRPPP